ncbi:conserved hypothetical protein [Methylobacterium nodulans ORS 2060]|uniref:Tetratricopeptide domain protein n=1 Tax=Methylobacterium nodulans (strain LMG 21967 / CNCM I-2342 / ORS 2060) TaxID=460265 RepID=B8IV86_METNO|nr:conserved hypothetical protein [Methylobacterium nodulans ORS 2060]
MTATTCAVAAGRDASHNTLTCNFGLTPEQLREVTKAAVEGAGSLLDRVEAISRRLGITSSAAQTLLRIVGEQPDVPDERLAEVLTKVATDYMRLKAQVAGLNPDNPTAKALVASAQAEIEAGHLDRGRELLRQATQAQLAAAEAAEQLRDQAQAAVDAQKLGAARSTAAEGDVAQTERKYLEAAELYGQAASYVPSRHLDEHSALVERQAGALYWQGYERGDNDALRKSADLCRTVLAERPRERVPLEWAGTQNNLGLALQRLGERESGPARLEQAVAAYTAVLEEYTRERVPLAWAMTQNNLGNALKALGERESGPGRLEQAVAAYTAALQERTRERVPLDWAQTQMNLGTALQRLGERESGPGRLEQAVAAFTAALEEYTRERVPLDWAMTQNNLGTALFRLGERESGTGRLEQAVAAYTAALQERTRERVPLDWAQTQMNLGLALAVLGERESGPARLEQAVAAYTAALQERTRERVPLDWAMTQNNLGLVLAVLGERESGPGRLEQAVAAYTAALQERTRERVPLDWAQTQMNLGTALQRLGERESGPGRLEQAVAAFDASLSVIAGVWPPEWVADVRARRAKAQAEIFLRQ